MTGFLAMMAARAVGAAPALRPRPVQRFEATADTASHERRHSPMDRGASRLPLDPRRGQGAAGDTPKPDEDAPPADTTGPAQPALPTGDVAGMPEEGAQISATPEAPARVAGQPEAPAQVAGQPGEAAATLRGALREGMAQAAGTPRGEDAGGAARRQPDVESSPPAGRREEPGVPEATPPDAAQAGAAPGDPATRARSAPTGPTAPMPTTDARPMAPVGGPHPPGPGRRPTPRPRSAPPVNLAALLRDEVFGALVARGEVPAGERVVVETRRSPQPLPAGTTALRAEGVRGPELDGADRAGDVHVHIDRVTVTRPRPDPPPAAPRAPVVDHAAYLARRRERR